MKWLHRKRDADDAQQELERATRRLAQVRRQWPEVIHQSSTSRAHTERNHISALLVNLYTGRTQ